jgi:hypothetical protein
VGGIVDDDTPPDPPIDYAATSTACPRSNAAATRLPYNYLPYGELVSLFPINVDVYRIKRTRTATRQISHLDGALDSCDVLSGSIKGPSGQPPITQARVHSCVRCQGFDASVNCNVEVDCSSTMVDFFDAEATSQQPTTATFLIERTDNDDITCDQARAFAFTP